MSKLFFKNSRQFEKGFTLIELLVVMVILGLLALVGLGSYQTTQMKSRDAKRKNDLNQLQKSLEMYNNDKSVYPSLLPGSGGEWRDAASGELYIKEVPADPKYGDYFYESNGQYYKIYARLENTKDPAIPKDADGNPSSYSGTVCGEEPCNYGVSSSNTSL